MTSEIEPTTSQPCYHVSHDKSIQFRIRPYRYLRNKFQSPHSVDVNKLPTEFNASKLIALDTTPHTQSTSFNLTVNSHIVQ
jgi:hypothetical protein